MRRRALLASVAAGVAGLAGCSRTIGSAGTTTPDDPPTSTATTTGTTTTDDAPGDDQASGLPENYASVVDLETELRTYAFAPTRLHTDDDGEVVLWFADTATADHPAVLRGWLENANDYENTFDLRWIPAVGAVDGRIRGNVDRHAELHLAPTGNNELRTTTPAVERTEQGFWRATDLGSWVQERVRLDPGERVQLEYVVVGGPESTDRPTGTYTFRGDDRDARIAVWNTRSPGPEAESRFAGRTPPAFEGDATTQWFHEADASTAVFVRPSTERLELDGRLEVTAVNHGRETARCGHWNLHKLVDGEWFHVAPWGHLSDCRGLVPGERLTWSLGAFNGEPVACDCEGLGLTQGYLGGGEYAVVAGYGHPADESAALVEFAGDPVEVVPTAGASVDRAGATVTVTTAHWSDGDDVPNATVTVTPVDSADERLIAEQVMDATTWGPRSHALRNALAPFENGVERVVVRTDANAANAAVDGDVRRFRFRGRAYEARKAIETG